MTSCVFCDGTAAVSFDLEHPQLPAGVRIDVCGECTTALRNPEKGECSLCNGFDHNLIPERTHTEVTVGDIRLCDDCYYPIDEELMEAAAEA